MDNTINLNTNTTVSTYKPQTLVINDKKELYRSYMPFIKGGGIFLPFNEEITSGKIAAGQKILVILSLFDSRDRIPISGKVVWISRSGPHKGFGIALGEGNVMKSLKDQIEAIILEHSAKKEPTYTL